MPRPYTKRNGRPTREDLLRALELIEIDASAIVGKWDDIPAAVRLQVRPIQTRALRVLIRARRR